jgi:hypothetical protein
LPPNRHAVMTFLIEWNFALPQSSRATVGKMNPSVQRGIMAKYKLMFAIERKGYAAWT